MKGKIIIIFALSLICGLSGCNRATTFGQYDTEGIGYIAFTDIDTVCDTPKLTEAGADLLTSLEEEILLSFVIDSSIDVADELGEYDHLILTNSQWVARFGEMDKLKPLEYADLSNAMQEFLNIQMPIWTVDGNVLPDGMGVYQYEGDKLWAFPVNVTLGAAKPVEAESPLIILVDSPAKSLNARRCMLPLASSGNVLFTDKNSLENLFELSELNNYGTIETMK